jgi:hypothetical protein
MIHHEDTDCGNDDLMIAKQGTQSSLTDQAWQLLGTGAPEGLSTAGTRAQAASMTHTIDSHLDVLQVDNKALVTAQDG